MKLQQAVENVRKALRRVQGDADVHDVLKSSLDFILSNLAPQEEPKEEKAVDTQLSS